MPLLESSKALNLTQEMDNVWLDLIKDFKAGGDPTRGTQVPWICQCHESHDLLIMYDNIWTER